MTIRTALAALLTAAFLLGGVGVAQAAEVRVPTTSTIKLITNGPVRDGGSFIICYMTETDVIMAERVKVNLEYQSVRSTAPWKSIYPDPFKIEANRTYCTEYVISGSVDTKIRFRTFNGPTNLASVSRVVLLDLE